MRQAVKKSSSYSLLLIIIIVFLLFLVAYLSYSFKQLSNYQDQAVDQTNFQPLTEDPPNDSLINKTNNITTFTHPTLQYTIDFPSDWKPKLFTSPAGRSVQPYRDLILYSPGYDPKLSNESSLIQQKNASILIRVAETTYENVEDKFNDNLAAQKIARNITRNNISGIPAIQYDYSFKGDNATVITMATDGLWYFVKFQYDNEEIKRQYLGVFQSVLNSFKTKQ